MTPAPQGAHTRAQQFVDENPVTAAAWGLDVALRQLADLTAAHQRLTEEKNGAYRERDALVCALSKLWPAHLADHPAEDTSWEDDWRTIVCIHSPVGQLCWHIRSDEVQHFQHLERTANDWDGHSTPDKYARLLALQCDDTLVSYLKDNETPAECIERNRKDIDALMTVLHQRTVDVERLQQENEELRQRAIGHRHVLADSYQLKTENERLKADLAACQRRAEEAEQPPDLVTCERCDSVVPRRAYHRCPPGEMKLPKVKANA